MATHVAQTTYIEFDRVKGVIKVYAIKTGELLYELKVTPCSL